MTIKSERPIYQLVSDHLEKVTEPVTCATLMENPAIRKEAVSEYGGPTRDVQLATNKLSDLLGFMWRRGLLTRYPAPRTETSFAKYAYTMAEVKEVEAKEIPPPARLTKHGVIITEHAEGIEIELDKMTIFIRPKQ